MPSCRGTLDPISGTCTCSFSSTGPDCSQSLLPACSFGAAHSPIRPLFWVQRITEPKSYGPSRATVLSWRRSAALGHLPCQCVRELLLLTSPFRNKWSLLPSSVLCATRAGTSQEPTSLAALLEQGGAAFTWHNMSIRFDMASRKYSFGLDGTDWASIVEPFFGGRLLPLSACIDECDHLGWCMASAASNSSLNTPFARGLWSSLAGSSAQLRGSCRCFPEAVRTRRGSCVRIQRAEPPDIAKAAARARSHDDPRGSHASLEWGVRVGEPLLGRAVGGVSEVPLYEPSSASVSFNFMRCPLNCSGHGECDLQGFCTCDTGYWGLDCGVTADGSGGGRPVAWRHSRSRFAPSPRVYVYDLDVEWRVGPQLLGEHDLALTERLLLSPHREADPLKADYFWIAGPNLQPLAKLEYVRRKWPHWNRTLVDAGGSDTLAARHILALLSERGVGDTDLRPAVSTQLLGPWSSRRAERPDPPIDGDLHPASRRRAWLALGLNGMADFRQGSPRRSGVARGATPPDHGPACHVCFRPGVDIIIPPPAATIDVPPCKELRAILSATSDTRRDTLLFWAGRVVPAAHRMNPMYNDALNVREELLRLSDEQGFKIVNTFPAKRNGTDASGGKGVGDKGGGKGGETWVNVVEWMRRSTFCVVPPGQRYGDARRHILAAFLGCVPVLAIPDGHHTLEEILPWREMAVVVPPERLAQLPAILRSVTPATIQSMRRKLHCARKYLWYSSIYGSCAPGIGKGEPDAFDGLMRVLAARLRPMAAVGVKPEELFRSECGL